MKRVIIPENLNFKSVSCGFECHDTKELIEFVKFFISIKCSFKVGGLYIEPEGELIPLKRLFEKREVYEYILLEFEEM